jgi:t-SNARE complex subunit (syntaxin)
MRKENAVNNTIEMCINLHKEKLENFSEEKIFVKTSEFDKVSTEANNLAINKFKSIFDEDSEGSNAHYLLKVL